MYSFHKDLDQKIMHELKCYKEKSGTIISTSPINAEHNLLNAFSFMA